MDAGTEGDFLMAFALVFLWIVFFIFFAARWGFTPLVSVPVALFLFFLFATWSGTWPTYFDPAIREAISAAVRP